MKRDWKGQQELTLQSLVGHVLCGFPPAHRGSYRRSLGRRVTWSGSLFGKIPLASVYVRHYKYVWRMARAGGKKAGRRPLKEDSDKR